MNLYLFNISTDLDNPALAANCDFIEYASRHCSNVFVFSTHVGRYSFGPNVLVREIGGGSLLARTRGAIFMLVAIFNIWRDKSYKKILIHMNDRAAILVCPIMKLFKVKTNLWYSHAYASKSLKVVNKFVTKIVTTSKYAYPLEHPNVMSIGQLILSNKFVEKMTKQRAHISRNKIVHLGRVTGAKHLVEFLENVASINEVHLPKISFIGGATGKDDLNYKRICDQIIEKNSLKVEWLGPIIRNKVPTLLKDYLIVYSGTNKAIDKSAVEAAMGGCLVVSSNLELLELVGISDYYQSKLRENYLSIKRQIELLLFQETLDEIVKLSRFVSHTTFINCNLESRIKNFLDSLD